MDEKLSVGIVAPSSKVPRLEFELGVEKIAAAGIIPYVHPQCLASHRYFAGTDDERAEAFYEAAIDPHFDVVWCARGGYGSARLLPLLDRLTAERGLPERKLLVGYSDATAVAEYVRSRWGWATLHASMPGLRKFCVLGAAEWKATLSLIRGEKLASPWGRTKLRFLCHKPTRAIEGEVVGGNLSVWTSLIGTPYLPKLRGKILFVEDVDEWLYRLDRMLNQLELAGHLQGVRAIVLGNFLNCRDSVPNVLAKRPSVKRMVEAIEHPRPSELEPLRERLDESKTIAAMFAEVGRRLDIPVAWGLPVGHGPEKFPLPLGAQMRLAPDGRFEIRKWTWDGG